MSGSGATPRYLAENWERLSGPQRLHGVDLARSLAVIGMLAAHLLWLPATFLFGEPSTWGAVASGRSSILFATLAGVSIGILTGGAVPFIGERMTVARLRLVVRGCVLGLLGVALILTGVPVYVILPAYALLFLLSIAMVSLRAPALFAIAGCVGLVMPLVQVLLDDLPLWSGPFGDEASALLGWHYPFTTWIAFVAAGLGLARADLSRTRTQVWALAAGAALAALGYGAHTLIGADVESERAGFWGAVLTARPHSTGLLEVIGSGGFALAVLALCVLLCRTPLTWVVLPLRALGSMPLTAYCAQLLAWAAIATVALDRVGDLAGFRDLGPFVPMTVVLVVWCTLWALLIGRGPLEWAIDALARKMAPSPVARLER